MNDNLIVTLQNYGFSEKEAKVYITALSLGSAPASTIARNSNENRTTVYTILGDLVKRGMFSTVSRENITYYTPISPEILVKTYEQKYKALQEKLPELMALGNTFGGLGKIKTFEGKNALKNLFLELATTECDVKLLQGGIKLSEDGNIYPEEELKIYRNEKIKKGLCTYRIVPENNRKQEEENKSDLEKKHKRQTLVLKNFDLNLKTSIHIYGPNKLAFMFFENAYPYVIIVENELLYEHIKKIFDYLRTMNFITEK